MTTNDIYSIFDKDGLLDRQFKSYEYREGQLLMAQLVQQSYERNAIAAIEAGTGIGKSFAYLAVALYHAIQDPDERTVIATSTINLQKQLYEKDLPMLFSFLNLKVKTALAVGRANYVCLNRFIQTSGQVSLLAEDPQSELFKVKQWLKSSETGLFADYTEPLSHELRTEIYSDGDLCINHKCPYFKECFFFKAKAKMKDAKIIISNHHLLFTDAQSRYLSDAGYDVEMILPPFNRLIIDEAHNIENNATEFFTEEYDSQQMLRQIARIQRSGRFSKKSLLEQLGEFNSEAELLERISDDIHLLLKEVDTLDQYLLQVFRKNDFQPVMIKVEQQVKLEQFVTVANSVAQASGRLAAKILSFVERSKAPDELEGRLHELKVRGSRIAMMSEVLTKFCNFAQWQDEVHWFNAEAYNQKRSVQVRITPLSIAPLLVDALFSKLDTVVCTSATLDLNDDFAFWASRVGLPYADSRPFLKGSYSSPFDYKNRLLLLTPTDAPLVLKEVQDSYVAYMADTINKAVMSCGGGALVLFTSYSLLKQVKSMLEDSFAQENMQLFAQGDLDRYTLLSRFIKERDSTLFATSSFWEGIDAPGDTLRLVIIVKLPFTVPSDPVFKARCDAIDKAGGSGFYQLALQSATMRLKQGFGRLLRSRGDRGVVLILDSRLVSKNYGVYMLRSLPESYHPDTQTSTMCDKIENFLYGS